MVEDLLKVKLLEEFIEESAKLNYTLSELEF